MDAFIRLLILVSTDASEKYLDQKYHMSRDKMSDKVNIWFKPLMEEHQALAAAIATSKMRRAKIWTDAARRLDILFYGSSHNPNISFPGDLRIRYGTSTPHGFKSEKRNSYKTSPYTPGHVRKTYTALGLSTIESQLKHIWDNCKTNSILRSQCFQALISYLENLEGFNVIPAEHYHILCNSIGMFVDDLKTSGSRPKDHEQATRIITAATQYKTTLSDSQIARMVSLNRKRFVKLHRSSASSSMPYSDEDSSNEESNHSSSSSSGHSAPEHFHAGTANDSAKSSIEDSGADSSSEDEADRLVKICNDRRHKYSNNRDLTVAVDFWHSRCQYNTNTNKEYQVLDRIGPGAQHVYHRQHLQTETTKNLYAEFSQCEAYLAYISENSAHSIGQVLFKSAKCPCIKWDRLRKCADTVSVQFDEYFKAMKRIYAKDDYKRVKQCSCSTHQSPNFLKTITNSHIFLNSILCPQIEYEKLVKTGLCYTSALQEAERKKSVEHADEKLQLKRDRSSSSSAALLRQDFHKPGPALIDSSRAVQHEVFRGHLINCCKSQCANCGVRRLINPDCPLVNDASMLVSYREYVYSQVVSGNGSVSYKKHKVLTQKSSTYKAFFTKFIDFIPTFILHHWFSRWDKFQRELTMESLVFHTDFSATYTCSGQDEATCAQANTAIQQVFVVTFIDLNTSKQINESWHFGDKVDSNSPTSNYMFDFTCKVKIIKHYQTLFPN
jgi:hypothetical protein